jgi:hypothetical protein
MKPIGFCRSSRCAIAALAVAVALMGPLSGAASARGGGFHGGGFAGGGFHGGGFHAGGFHTGGFGAGGFRGGFGHANFGGDHFDHLHARGFNGWWLGGLLPGVADPYFDDDDRAYGYSAALPNQSYPTQYWYYCQNPAGYYPYVTQCSSAWQPVPAG